MKTKKMSTAKIILKVVFGVFLLFFLTLLIVLIFFRLYLNSFKEDIIDLEIEASRFSRNSSIYIVDDRGATKEYQKVFGNEARVWLKFSEIPKHMVDAIISIEDKRFYSHSGIDFIRSAGAIYNAIVLHKPSYGGSTLTQQLIKNVTQDNEFTSSRKAREMARAIRLEKKYSKDEILEFYLNIVNFGAGSRGVEMASQIYFGKSIKKCSIAEFASIAAITQNPRLFNPITNPENNKKRRNLIINEMHKQNRISNNEYKTSISESENLKFNKNSKTENKKSQKLLKNWYIEIMCKEISDDLIKKYKIKKGMAEDILFSSGLNIYCAMDENMQDRCEEVIKDKNIMPKDPDLELGFIMMDYNGRILAMLGSSKPKTENFIFDRCNLARRQPGSTIKPLSVYTPAIERGIYHFSSVIADEPLEIGRNEDGSAKKWPENWYKKYHGKVILQWAIEKSANAPAAQILNKIGLQESFSFLTQKLKILNLDSNDSNSFSALATGGTHVGLTVREMTCAFQIFGNEGKYAKPYTYLYVTDSENRVILDNRKKPPKNVIKPETAGIVNRLLRQVIIGSEGTGRAANIDGVEIIGKTGTTNNDYDLWFIGLTPYFCAGIRVGYDTPKRINDTKAAIRIWRSIVIKFLLNKPKKDFKYSENLVKREYCCETGCLANKNCYPKKCGYYDINNLPKSCYLHTDD
ncbi:MAG: transglycosylase domain-containing protein [Candidatus Improbicoccus pseudotrichonymphae]|uniref:Penicillin-binding protein 1A n=1 Tax=Candidatus Improbicoccus pseudotrichonymphae TaxID=3033792 RepID=A0AA48HY62_9FIRM|nr:MAG: transglycosylase domain-containing protein [Candidatus Improbicoccus pseudotrichonymphae]